MEPLENTSYNPNTAGARQRRASTNTNDGNYTYSSIPTQQVSGAGYSYDADSLKKKSTSYSAPTLNSITQRSYGFASPSFFHSAAHMTEGPHQPYYRDNFNDQPYNFVFGTSEDDGIWMNSSDSAGS